ncbi:MAG TPA: GIY-YIG nuclease family protein [Galbitalea sp.]|jgi:hypothetical protein
MPGVTNEICAACDQPADTAAGLGLCAAHILAAHDWVVRETGVTDLLPSPCLACGSRLGVRYPSGWLCAICEWRVGDIPDGETRAPRVDVVYYIRFRDRIKIGTSATPRSRIAALPCDEVLAFERGARPLEQRRHAQFAADRIGTGEWFRPSEALLAHIDELAAGVDDPWHRYALWVSIALALRG